MEDKKSEENRVIAAIEENGGNLTFDELEKSTGLGFVELSTVIGLLMKKNRLLMRVNHATKSTYLYKTPQEALFAKFKDLLFVYHGKERKVSFYASKLCITPKYLCFIVKSISGKLPTEWIKEETIKEIEYLLCHSQASIKEIVCWLNFPNLSFFGKYFKSAKGVSPKRYRENYINKYQSLCV